MRCEVCGVPIPEGEVRCARCQKPREPSMVPPERPASTPPLRASARPTVEPAGDPPTEQPEGYMVQQAERISDDPPPVRRVSSETIPARPARDSDPENIEGRKRALPLPKLDRPSTLPPSCVVLEGKYRLRTELGRGAMGTVFLAQDTTLKRDVAVKFLLPELVDSPECATRFHREAVAMAAIRNENVAQIFSFGDQDGSPYFVMEYLDGQSVEELIDAHNRRGFYIPLDDVLDIMIQSLQGLSAIHRAGAVHRDIKPANIMICNEPLRAVIMDFGLVRDVKVEDDMRTLAGTPAYIAPELVEGRPEADRSPLADIYSMGTTFYEILTGSIPFGGDTWIEILQKHITEVPVFPSVRRPGLPEKIDDIILRAMSKEPRERYQSCDEFLEELVDVADMPLPHEKRSSLLPAGRRSQPPGKRYQSRGRSYDTPNRAFRSTPSGSRGRLLVADANAEFRALVHGTAKAAVPGCRVHSATDGEMALELIDSVNPHVLLVELSLPRINGLELVATVRGEAGNEEMDIIVVAENGGTREAEILKSFGITGFLTKPIDSESLAGLLRPLLERPMSRRSSNAPR